MRMSAVLVAGALLGASALPAWAEGHCGAGETVWFNAAVKDSDKVVSICGGTDWLAYRFGKPGKVELTVPKRRKGSLEAFTLRRYTRPQVTYLKLEFANGGFVYAIHDDFDGEAGTPEEAVSLTVTKDGAEEPAATFDLVPSTEPLNLMGLEDKVQAAPYDE